MDNTEFYSNFLGSSTANVMFVFLFGLALWLRKRLKVTKCASHCGLFDCEAQLQELQIVREQVHTQRGMLENVLEILDGSSVAPRLRPANIVVPENKPEPKVQKKTNI